MKKEISYNGKKVNVELNEGEFIAWTVTDSNNIIITTDDNIIFKTKKAAEEYCETAWKGCYSSKAEMMRDLHFVKYIFAGTTPVRSLDDEIEKIEKKNDKKMEKTNCNLKAMFDEFNEKYFSNSISSDWKVEFTPAKKTYIGITYHHNKLIRVTDNMDEFSTKATLIHEMCHAALPKTSGHGKDFKSLVKRVSEMSGIDYESIAGCKDYVVEYRKPVELTNAVVKSISYSSSDGGYKMQVNVKVTYTKSRFNHYLMVFIPWAEPENFWTGDKKAENEAKKAAKNMVCGVLEDIPEPEIKDRDDVRKYYDSVNEMFVKDENGCITAVR